MAESSETTSKPQPWGMLGALALLGLVAGLGLSIYLSSSSEPTPEPQPPALLWPNPKAVTAFELNDQNGEPFNVGRLYGRWSFLFFGYTHCPDVCPLTLTFFRQLKTRLQTEQPDLTAQYVFVTVDPERDTTERLREYIGYFDPTFVGVTGSEGDMLSFTSRLGVVAKRMDGDPENYLVDHSASILLLDPHGRLVGVFAIPHELDYVAEQFQAIVRFLEAQS